MMTMPVIFMNTSVENVTEPNYIRDAIYSIIPMIILIIGVPGNLLSMIIWLRRLYSTCGSTSLFIGIMCLTDTYVLIHGCIRQWLIGITHSKTDIRRLLNCRLPLFLFTFTTDFSTWIIILLCIERAICVWTPIRFKQWCKLQNGTIAISFVAFVLVGINLHYFWTVKPHEQSCIVDENYEDFHKNWPYLDFAIYSFIPLACIILVNTSIVWKMKSKSLTLRKNLNQTQNNLNKQKYLLKSDQSSTNREQRSTRVLRTVICMTISHFILTMPVVFFFLFESKFYKETDKLTKFIGDLIECITVILQMINHMTHFFIYSCTSTIFLSDLNRLCSNFHPTCCISSHLIQTTIPVTINTNNLNNMRNNTQINKYSDTNNNNNSDNNKNNNTNFNCDIQNN